MSGLIDGMTIPTEGEYRMTLYVCPDGSAYIDVASFPVDKDRFAVIPVPEHGRLTDADAVGDFLRNKYWNSPWVRSHILDKIVRDIKGFQTIIPADHFGNANEMVTDKEGEG